MIGPRPRRLAIRIWTVAAMLALTVAAGRFITPRVAAIRDAAGGRVSALAESDPRRVEFNRLHGLSTAVMLVTMLAAAGLLFAEVRDGTDNRRVQSPGGPSPRLGVQRSQGSGLQGSVWLSPSFLHAAGDLVLSESVSAIAPYPR